MAQIKRSRLFTRVLLALVALFAGSAALSAAFAAYHLADVLDAQYRSKGEAIGQTIGNSSVEDILLQNDLASLQALVDQYAEIEGVGYILVRAGDGEILAHTFAPAVPDSLRAVPTDRPVVRLDVAGESYMHVSAPILEGEIGHVHVGMKQATIDAAYWDTIRRQTFLGGLIGLIAVLVAYLLVQRITRPLLRLAQHARTVATLDSLQARDAAGDLSPIAARTDEVGQLARALKHMIEAISEREQRLKVAELSIRLSEQKFRSLIENVSDVVVLLGQQNEALYISPSLRQLLDFSPREWIGREVLPLFHPEDREAFRSALASCVPAQASDGTTSEWRETSSAEARMIRADGTIRIVDVALCNLLDDPAVEGIVVTLRDMTDRKRTLELAQARDAAEEANRLKSEFLANISHEIRTPMHHIINLTDLALSSTTEAEPRDYLEVMRTSADGLTTILNDILDFSCIEAGNLEIEATPFRLRDLVGDALSLVAARAHEKGLELLWEVDSDVPEIAIGDDNRLRQVLLNLVGNAIKFTASGEVVVHVGLQIADCRLQIERQPDAQTPPEAPANGASHLHSAICNLQFRVSDTGIGIAADKLGLIFLPFTQADGSMTRTHGGTGLGLAIARSLVALMGGELGVSSELGAGSEFTFTAVVGIGTEEQLPARELPPAEGLNGLRVLVVDDNETNGRIVSELLRRWGMSPVVVNGGESALAALDESDSRSEVFHLVLLDAQMPGMDGYTLAERLRGRLGAGAAALLMLSSTDRVEGGARCRDLGLTGYLTKPLKPAELQAALLSALTARAV